MITVLILGLFALVMMGVLLRVVRGQSAAVNRLEELAGRTQPVDLEAFRNLTDPREEEYLRAELAPEDFRVLQRERFRGALEYVQRVSGNATVLLRVGEAARRSQDPEVARAGGELAENALSLRMHALLAVGLLRARILFPDARWSPVRLVADYQRVRDGVARLSRLQRPEYAGHISAAL